MASTQEVLGFLPPPPGWKRQPDLTRGHYLSTGQRLPLRPRTRVAMQASNEEDESPPPPPTPSLPIRLTIWLETTTAAWRAALRGRTQPILRSRPLPRLLTDTDTGLPPFLRQSPHPSAPASPSTRAVRSPTLYRLLLFRNGAAGCRHRPEYIARALLQYAPWLSFGAASTVARQVVHHGQAQLLVSDLHTAERCCTGLLADGIMSNVEPAPKRE